MPLSNPDLIQLPVVSHEHTQVLFKGGEGGTFEGGVMATGLFNMTTAHC